MIVAAHGARTPERWSERFSSCPRNVRLLDEQTFLVDRNMMLTRGELTPDSWSRKGKKQKNEP